MHYKYKTKGICAVSVEFDLEENNINNIIFNGGCDGNHKGITALVEGMDAKEIIKRLKGIKCGLRNSSCPDQLAMAIEECLNNK